VQLHDDSIPSEARLSLGKEDIADVVLTIILIAGKLQSKLTSGSILGLATVDPHYVCTLLRSTKYMYRLVIAVVPPIIGTTLAIVVSAFKVIVYEGSVSAAVVVAPVV
jgi:hypothetical protein